MLAFLAALFFLGYINSCDSETSNQIVDKSTPSETVQVQ